MLDATYVPLARGLSVDAHALDTSATAPPGRASSYYRAPPAHTVRHARAARDETACGAPTHRPPSPSRAAPALPTRRASPNTDPVASDSVPLAGRGTPHAVAH